MATIDELMALNKDIDEKDVNEAVDELMKGIDENDTIDSMINNPLSLYMYEMSRWEPFTIEEERQIFKELSETESEDRKKQLKDEIFNRNIRLVVYVAKRYYRNLKHIEPIDLINEASIGLLRAIDRYDYTTGYKFSTYAYWWINQACTRSIANDNDLIRQPVHIHELIIKVKKAQRKWEQTHDSNAPVDYIAKELNVSEEKVRNILIVMDCQSNYISLDCQMNKGSGEPGDTEVGEIVPDPRGNIDFEEAEINQFQDRIIEILSGSNNKISSSSNRNVMKTERMVDVIKRRFGFDGCKVETLEEIAQSYGICRERVRQIEAQALRILRNPKYKRELATWK